MTQIQLELTRRSEVIKEYACIFKGKGSTDKGGAENGFMPFVVFFYLGESTAKRLAAEK